VFAEALVRTGSSHLFGLIGHTTLPVIGNVVRQGTLCYVPARHEGNAVMMAHGYARTTGRLGLVTTIHGPGFTNTITALIASARHSVPMLVFVGELSSTDRSGGQWSDIEQLARVAEVGFHRTSRPEKLGTLVDSACTAAFGEQRPQMVVTDLPQLLGEIELIERLDLSFSPGRAIPAPASLDRAADLLRASRRPVILAGRGAVRANAGAELRLLAEELGALVCTSMLAYGLFAGYPFDLRVAGGHTSSRSRELIADADCVLVVGASLNLYQTDRYRLFSNATLIQCDEDISAIAPIEHIDHAVIGDAHLVASGLLERLRESPRQGRYQNCQVRARLDAIPPVADAGSLDRLDPIVVLTRLDQSLPTERTVVMSTTGPLAERCVELVRVPDASGWVWAHGFASIGFGLGTAIGAALGRPERLTVLIVGDGSFMMCAQELDSAVNADVRMLVVVLNDRAYGTEVHQLAALGLPVSSAEMGTPDLAALARAYGADGETLRSPADLERLNSIVQDLHGTFVLDVRTATLGPRP
jgi:thiamine pyrophosphate-dependent acetolactate synthase large subunit-like protein